LSFKSVGGDEHDVNLSGRDEHVLSNVDDNDIDEWKQETHKIFYALKIYFILKIFWSIWDATRFFRAVNRNFRHFVDMSYAYACY
jgi:hypothetical protein